MIRHALCLLLLILPIESSFAQRSGASNSGGDTQIIGEFYDHAWDFYEGLADLDDKAWERIEARVGFTRAHADALLDLLVSESIDPDILTEEEMKTQFGKYTAYYDGKLDQFYVNEDAWYIPEKTGLVQNPRNPSKVRHELCRKFGFDEYRTSTYLSREIKGTIPDQPLAKKDKGKDKVVKKSEPPKTKPKPKAAPATKTVADPFPGFKDFTVSVSGDARAHYRPGGGAGGTTRGTLGGTLDFRKGEKGIEARIRHSYPNNKSKQGGLSQFPLQFSSDWTPGTKVGTGKYEYRLEPTVNGGILLKRSGGISLILDLNREQIEITAFGYSSTKMDPTGNREEFRTGIGLIQTPKIITFTGGRVIRH